jgi:hypothetical protein
MAVMEKKVRRKLEYEAFVYSSPTEITAEGKGDQWV